MLQLLLDQMEALPDREMTRESRRRRYKNRQAKIVDEDASWKHKFSEIAEIPAFALKPAEIEEKRPRKKKKRLVRRKTAEELEAERLDFDTRRYKIMFGQDWKPTFFVTLEEEPPDEPLDPPVFDIYWWRDKERRNAFEMLLHEEFAHNMYMKVVEERERKMKDVRHNDPSMPFMPRKMRERARLKTLTDPSLNPRDISIFDDENLLMAQSPSPNLVEKCYEKRERLQDARETLDVQNLETDQENLLDALDLDRVRFSSDAVEIQEEKEEEEDVTVNETMRFPTVSDHNPAMDILDPSRFDDEHPVEEDVPIIENALLMEEDQMLNAADIDDFFVQMMNNDEFKEDPVAAYAAEQEAHGSFF